MLYAVTRFCALSFLRDLLVNERKRKIGLSGLPVGAPIPDLDDKCKMNLGEHGEVLVYATELERLEELGRGAYGVVEKMKHKETGVELAVKVRLCRKTYFKIKDPQNKRTSEYRAAGR